MSGILEDCFRYFNTKNLYEVFGVSRDSKPADLKKAYYKKSLECHPDTNQTDNKETSTAKFQIVSKVYSVLADSEKRKIYDETGTIDSEENLSKDYEEWVDYWRLLFPKVTLSKVKDFHATYQGSDQERQDLRDLYLRHEGNMDQIMASMLFAEHPEEDRLRAILQQLISANEVPSYAQFTNESPRRAARRAKRWEQEQREFFKEQEREKRANQKRKFTAADEAECGGAGSAGCSDLDSLTKQIAARQADRMKQSEDLLERLTAKYGGGSAKAKGKKVMK